MAGEAQQLGRFIGNLSRKVDTVQENLNASESNAVLQIYSEQVIEVQGYYSLVRKNYALNTLVWDHPVYGDLDVFVWDGGYLVSTTGAPFPLSFSGGGFFFNAINVSGSSLMSSGVY